MTRVRVVCRQQVWRCDECDGARLAVVGSHGRGALARLLLGSISHEVLARLATVTAIVR